MSLNFIFTLIILIVVLIGLVFYIESRIEDKMENTDDYEVKKKYSLGLGLFKFIMFGSFPIIAMFYQLQYQEKNEFLLAYFVGALIIPAYLFYIYIIKRPYK